MKPFWEYTFHDTKDLLSTFDELPLWSAQFGLLLLDNIEIAPYSKVVDIGSGAGFPLLELAERLGEQTKCYGIDPWKNANERAQLKVIDYCVSNVEIIEASAEKMPFEDDSIDLIVSNLGINNFERPPSIFDECRRVLKPKCKLALTTNLNGHWIEFYKVFEDTCAQLDKMELVELLKKEQEHRGTMEDVSRFFTDAGFNITNIVQNETKMRFLNGSAFLNHHFIKMGWLSSWISIIPDDDRRAVFMLLEENLNKYASSRRLSLTIPMLFVEGEKIRY